MTKTRSNLNLHRLSSAGRETNINQLITQIKVKWQEGQTLQRNE